MIEILDALRLCGRLLGFAVLLQTLELISGRRHWAEGSAWGWDLIRTELSPGAAKIFSLLFGQGYSVLLAAQLLASGFLIASPSLASLVVLFFCLLSQQVRWRGRFNGGADAMTFVVVTGLIVGFASDRSSWQSAGLWWIAIQTTLSYFVSGFSKLIEKDWRSGKALLALTRSPLYFGGTSLHLTVRRAQILSFLLIGFECLFPVALFNTHLAVVFITCAAVFHLLNARYLGLNRFIWAWLSTYPALIWAVS